MARIPSKAASDKNRSEARALTESDFEPIRPQLNAAWEIISRWPIGKDIKELAALVALKTIAITLIQIRELGGWPETKETDHAENPDDGGFF